MAKLNPTEKARTLAFLAWQFRLQAAHEVFDNPAYYKGTGIEALDYEDRGLLSAADKLLRTPF